jgi:hypothetical protein
MRLRLSFASVLVAGSVLMAASLLGAAVATADDWLTYHNDRYGTTIDYPAIFKMQPPPDSDDGRTFKTADGAEFTVAALYNALDFTRGTYRDFIVKNLDHGSVVTYEAHGGDWFVVSGTKGDDVFYEKHLLSHDGEMAEDFVLSYPASLRSTYDPIVARMAKSFRPGKGFQSP